MRFGPEAVRAVQQVPQRTLLKQLDGLADDVAGELAARALRRYGADQTIERDDIACCTSAARTSSRPVQRLAAPGGSDGGDG